MDFCDARKLDLDVYKYSKIKFACTMTDVLKPKQFDLKILVNFTQPRVRDVLKGLNKGFTFQ